MGADEEGTLARLQVLRAEVIDPKVAEHHGRVVKTTGDGLLVEFASVVDAMRCATGWQAAMADHPQSATSRIDFRIGVNLGDIIIDGDDIFGDGVNIAARLETLAEPGGIRVNRVVRDQVRDKLDIAFEDMGEQQVKNIARPLRVFRTRIGDRPLTEPAEQAPLPLPDKPSIAVMSFDNLSSDPEQEYFADGMVEEIITALSRIRWLFVIARNSSFSYKGQSVDVRRVGRDLGVRYVLEGSVRKGGNRVRITAQLVDAATGAHLWADRFDGSLEDIFELQDNVAVSVAGVVEPTLRAAEIRRSSDRPTNDLTAYDLYLRALALGSPWERKGIVAALDLLGRAIERDPNYASALARAALCHVQLHLNGWNNDAGGDPCEGVKLARRAIQVMSDDPDVPAWSAYVLAYFGEDINAAVELMDRALTLNPSFAQGWYWSDWLRLWAGKPELAISHLGTSLRLSPTAGRAGTFMAIGVSNFVARRFEDASGMLLRSLQEHPAWAPTLRFLAACYAHMGRLDEAHEIVRRLRGITPVVVPEATHWRDPNQRELYLSGLRLAVGETQ